MIHSKNYLNLTKEYPSQLYIQQQSHSLNSLNNSVLYTQQQQPHGCESHLDTETPCVPDKDFYGKMKLHRKQGNNLLDLDTCKSVHSANLPAMLTKDQSLPWGVGSGDYCQAETIQAGGLSRNATGNCPAERLGEYSVRGSNSVRRLSAIEKDSDSLLDRKAQFELEDRTSCHGE